MSVIPEQISRPWWRQQAYGWAMGFGALHAWSLSPWCAAVHVLAPALLQTLALMGLLWLLSREGMPRGRVAMSLWLYGTVWLVGATGWMYVSLHDFGGLPGWLAVVAVVGLCAALSLYMAAVGWAWGRWRRHVWWRDALLFSALWLLAEMARAVIFTGFPWGASGYGLLETSLVKLAPLLGVYGLGAVWVWAVAMAVLAWRSASGVSVRCLVPAAMAGLLLVCAMWAAPEYTHVHGQPLRVTLLQGNVPQDEKFVPEHQLPKLVWHARQLLAAPGKLVIAPETAIPLLPSQLPEGYWDQIRAGFAAGTGRYALIGVPLGDLESGYTNSVAGLSGEAMATPEGMYRYNKHHLVPFGEVIPLGFHWFVEMMNMPLGDFTRGPVAAPAFKVGDQRIGPNICYEDLYGEEIAARFRDADTAPTILANVSNLAWFGEQVTIHQHLQIARMRSIEFQLPTLRATNTGATVVIDHTGRVTDALAPHTQGSLQATVQGRTGVTPFAWWAARWGLWPLFIAAVLMIGLSLGWPGKEQNRRSGEGARAIH